MRVHAATDIAQFLLALNINRGFNMTLEDCRRFLFPYKKKIPTVSHIFTNTLFQKRNMI